MRRPLNTVNGFYRDPNLHWSAQDALNVLPKVAEREGTRTVSELVDAPGLKPLVQIGTSVADGFTPAGPVRGLRVVDNRLFVGAGNGLWRITPAGVSVRLGTIPGVGRVSMAHNQRGNGNELAIDNGPSRYVLDTVSLVLQKVTDSTFQGSSKAFFIDGYLGYVEPAGRYWGHSDLSDALTYNSLDTYEAEGLPDRIVSANVNNREVQIFGSETVELYVNAPSGDGTAPFQRATSTMYPWGCAAKDAVSNVAGLTVFLDDKRCVRVLSGDRPISTSVIESILQGCSKQQIAQAYSFALEAEGFQIFYLTVPGVVTFGFDFRNGEWHRRASYGLEHWAVTDAVFWNGRWIVGDSRDGKLYELDWSAYPFDGENELVREWTTGVLHADQAPIRVDSVELLFAAGVEASPVGFPGQPIGPSLSGSAPDGFFGLEYPGYTYTVTAGDAPIVKTVIVSGNLPEGLTWDEATASISSGTVADSGGDLAVTLHLRTTDQNGLIANHTDTFEIVVPRWDPSHTGVGGVLENATRTFVSDTPAVQRPMTRSYVGFTAADKVYAEIVLDNMPDPNPGDPLLSIGPVNELHPVSDQPFVGASDEPVGPGPKGFGVLPGYATGQNANIAECGSILGDRVYGGNYSNKAVIRIAVDGPGSGLYLVAGPGWNHRKTVSGACELSMANPSTGLNPISPLGAFPAGAKLYIAMTGRDGSNGHVRATLRIYREEFTYAVPDGFVPLGDLA